MGAPSSGSGLCPAPPSGLEGTRDKVTVGAGFCGYHDAAPKPWWIEVSSGAPEAEQREGGHEEPLP